MILIILFLESIRTSAPIGSVRDGKLCPQATPVIIGFPKGLSNSSIISEIVKLCCGLEALQFEK